MKLACSSIFLFFLTASITAADVAEIEAGGGSIFDRSALLGNALCLPLFDGCNARSAVAGCSGQVPACSGGDACVKTVDNGVVCAKFSGQPVACTTSKDCQSGSVCAVFGSCTTNACVEQIH